MPQPASFFRSWRKKDRPQTSPTQGSAPFAEAHNPPRSSNSSPVSGRIQSTRRPSETPSEGSTRFLRLFKGSNTETDASGPGSGDETAQKAQVLMPALRRPHSPPSLHPPSPDAPTAPFGSPHSLERQLPPLPPVRPPRPPSLNLDTIELCPFNPPNSKSPGTTRLPRQRPLISEHSSRRKMPELDNVWEDFIKDVEGEDDDNFTIAPRRGRVATDRPIVSHQAVHAFLDPPSVRQSARPTLYHSIRGSGSTPYLAYNPESTDEEGSESSSDETSQGNAGFSLALFPAPPPLPRRRTTPKPLVLHPTPTIAPLPPSPSFSSRDSTPIATPTTPRSVDPSPYTSRKSVSPVSILKKPGTSLSPRSPVPAFTPLTEEPPRYFHDPSPRLRSAQSVPHLHPSSFLATTNAHRNTSSDTTSISNRRRVPSRPDGQRPLFYPKVQPPPPKPGNMEWGYAV
ncbi:hypothetical protein FB451DRAFT_1161619 [Mycena latifolia]|nr:hypothetical protein FB451DRAFT_1161619 [Mycena latifolia]